MMVLKKCLFVLIFFIFSLSIVQAKSVIQVINQGQEANYKVDTNYGFTFNMNNVSTTSSNYHLILSDRDIIDKKIYYDNNIDYSKWNYYYLDNESDCKDKKIYIMYNNIGMYKGNAVNLKITLNNCVFGYSNPGDSNKEFILKSYLYNGNKIRALKPSIGFDKESMKITLNGLRFATLKYEFIDDNGKKINIKGYGTLSDLDQGKAFKINSGIDKAYIYENYDSSRHLMANTLTTETDFTKTRILENAVQSSNYETYSDSNYKYAWSTLLFSGSEFELTYYLGKIDYLRSWWDNPLDYEGFGSGTFEFITPSLIPFSIEDPVNSSNKIVVEKNEYFTYKITHRVPYINKDNINIYSKYNIIDNLEECFEITKEDITIKNDENKDVTSNFDINIVKEDGLKKVYISAKKDFLNDPNFYGHEYVFMINTKVNDSEILSKYKNKSANEYIISNIAILNIDSNNNTYTKKTNNVNITIPIKKQIVSVDNTSKYISVIFVIIGISLIFCAVLIAFLYRIRNMNIK